MPRGRVIMHIAGGKGAFMRALGKRPFGLTAENLLKNPQGIASRVFETVERRLADRRADEERDRQGEVLVAKLNETGFEAAIVRGSVEVGNYNGTYVRETYDNTGVHVSLDVPAEKLALLKAFLDQLKA